MSLRKTMTAVVLAGAFATAPMLAYGQAQYLDKGGTPGTASASGQEAGSGAMGGLTAGTIAAGVAVAAAIAVAIAAASDDGDATTTTSTSTSTATRTAPTTGQ